MSFLNPVNEPVLRFKSTDAGAPQINYNARVAGDVKAVLKACLVTGYGATASAGWSVVNEVDHVAEFVSPSAAMSDYRLGVDDTSASSAIWYYQYQDARVNPSQNSLKKNFSYINKTHAENGWEALVTDRALIFIEHIYNTGINKPLSRITYFGALKSAVDTASGKNIAFWSIGYGAAIGWQFLAYKPATNFHAAVASYGDLEFASNVIGIAVRQNGTEYGVSNVDIIDGLLLTKNGLVIAKHPAVMFKSVNSVADLYSTENMTINSRSMLKLCAGFENGTVDTIKNYSVAVLISTDYWEF